jgi:predicted RND superfamily exporter protein
LVVAAICSAGVLFLETETSADELFFFDTESYRNEKKIKSVFEENIDGTAVYMQFSDAVDPASYEVMQDVFGVHQVVLAIRGLGGKTALDWCWRAGPADPCGSTNIFGWLGIADLAGLQAAVSSGSLASAMAQTDDFVDIDGLGRCLKLQYVYDSKGNDGSVDDYNDWKGDWETKAYEAILAQESAFMTISAMNMQLAMDETTRLTSDSVPLMMAAAATIVMVTAFVVSGRPCVRSRFLLACTCVLSVMLAMACAYGFAGYVGLKSNASTMLMVFVLFAIGVDDMIIIIRQTDAVEGDLKERIPRGLRDSGLAITLTSLTSAVAFASATQVELGMARGFCAFAIGAIIADWFFQATFFQGLFVYDERRRESGRLDGLCCLRVSSDPRSREVPTEQQSCSVDKLFQRFGKALMSRVGVAVSLLTWAAVLAATAPQLGNVSTKFDMKSYYPEDSPLRVALNVVERYYNGHTSYPTLYIIHGEGLRGRFFQEDELAALDATVEALEREDGVFYPSVGREEADWTFAYRRWIAGPGNLSQGKAFDQSLHDFLHAPGFPASNGTCPLQCIWPAEFKRAFVLDGDGFPLWSRIMLRAQIPQGPENIARTSNLKRIVNENKGPLDAFIHSYLFKEAERDERIEEVLYISLSLTCTAVVAILMVFLDVFIGIFVGVSIMLVDICVLGTLTGLGAPLTVVTFLNLTMVIGMCIDYIVHSAHGILHELRAGLAPDEAIISTMEKMGRWISEGALSTLCGLMLPALFASSEAARSFGSTMCLATFFGVAYGVVWGPTFLYIIASLLESVRAAYRGDKVQD